MKHLPKTTTLRLVEAIERDPPAGVEPIHWRLLTTHAVDDAAAAWRMSIGIGCAGSSSNCSG